MILPTHPVVLVFDSYEYQASLQQVSRTAKAAADERKGCKDRRHKARLKERLFKVRRGHGKFECRIRGWRRLIPHPLGDGMA